MVFFLPSDEATLMVFPMEICTEDNFYKVTIVNPGEHCFIDDLDGLLVPHGLHAMIKTNKRMQHYELHATQEKKHMKAPYATCIMYRYWSVKEDGEWNSSLRAAYMSANAGCRLRFTHTRMYGLRTKEVQAVLRKYYKGPWTT
jgi:hypothetical protein